MYSFVAMLNCGVEDRSLGVCIRGVRSSWRVVV
jgi:hypothetical protein